MTASQPRKPRVAVVFGGRSSEHGISCVTAGSVLAAIDRDAYDVVPVGIARDGRWVLESDEPARLALRGSELPSVDGGRSPVALLGDGSGTDLVVAEPTQVPDVIGEVADALEEAFRHDPKVLVETSMEGARELECGVLGTFDGPPQTTRLGELRVGGDHEFYDFEAKYLADQQTEIDIPADVPAGTEQELRAMAVRAFEALSCEGLARVDFFVKPDGSLVINELN